MEITVYYVVEHINADRVQYYSGPHPHYPSASLSMREAKYAALTNEDRYQVVEHTLTVKEL